MTLHLHLELIPVFLLGVSIGIIWTKTRVRAGKSI